MVEDWVPGVPNGERITLRQVLDHTSGVWNVTEHPDLEEMWSEPATPEEILALLDGHEPAFEPGTEWGYSNTNYVIAGMVVEEATGSTWAAEVRTRLLDPLGLADTFVSGDEEVTGGMVPGFTFEDGEWRDVTDSIHPSWAWAAGAMVSTVDDLVAWAEALFAGDVLGPDEHAEMLTPGVLLDGTVTQYGLGVGVFETPDGLVYGHAGGIPAYSAEFVYVPGIGLAAASLVNTWIGAHDVLENALAAYADATR